MANERQWDEVLPVLLTANGSTEGVLQVADTAGFFFGAQCTLVNNASLQLTVYIKRVVSNTILWVGPNKGGMDHNVDLSAFTTATASSIAAQMQNKSAVPMEARLLATYDTDPIDAWRVIPVDSYGNNYTATNPFPTVIENTAANPVPVTFDGTVTIGDVHILGPSPTNNELVVNADGSINVVVESAPSPNTTVISTYAEVTLVASGATIQIVTYTVPPAMQAVLQRAHFSGENVARYDLLINSIKQDTARTMFGADLTGEFNFTTGNDSGYLLNAGDVVSVQVYNSRPMVASFEARIQVLQIPT